MGAMINNTIILFRYIKILNILVVVLPVLLSSTHVIAIDDKTIVKPLPLEKMRVVAYSKVFAERFGLPLPLPGFETTDGLEAVEFSIEQKRPWSDFVSSNYRLYVDGNLPIQFPDNGGCGDVGLLIKNVHFFGQTKEKVMKWRKEDRYFFNEKNTQYARKALLASMDHEYGKRGASYGMWYEGFM